MLWTVHIKTSSRTSPGLRTYGVAERALERREDSFIHDSLAIARPVNPRVVSIPGLDGSFATLRAGSLFPRLLTAPLNLRIERL